MSESSIKSRRAALLIEAFLLDLSLPRLVEVQSQKLRFDFVVALRKRDGGLKYWAVETKHTDKPIERNFHFLEGRNFQRDSRSNMPTMLLIADTKRNVIYCGLASRARVVQQAHRAGISEYSVPVFEVSPSAEGKRQFKQLLLEND
jgi:hypothetical protein